MSKEIRIRHRDTESKEKHFWRFFSALSVSLWRMVFLSQRDRHAFFAISERALLLSVLDRFRGCGKEDSDREDDECAEHAEPWPLDHGHPGREFVHRMRAGRGWIEHVHQIDVLAAQEDHAYEGDGNRDGVAAVRSAALGEHADEEDA